MYGVECTALERKRSFATDTACQGTARLGAEESMSFVTSDECDQKIGATGYNVLLFSEF